MWTASFIGLLWAPANLGFENILRAWNNCHLPCHLLMRRCSDWFLYIFHKTMKEKCLQGIALCFSESGRIVSNTLKKNLDRLLHCFLFLQRFLVSQASRKIWVVIKVLFKTLKKFSEKIWVVKTLPKWVFHVVFLLGEF